MNADQSLSYTRTTQSSYSALDMQTSTIQPSWKVVEEYAGMVKLAAKNAGERAHQSRACDRR